MPAAKSTARKIASGTLRSDREPKPDSAARLPAFPLPPPHLSLGAQDQWAQLAPVAFALGTLTVADLVAFALLAETLATAELARRAVAAEGFAVATADGGSKANPAVKVMEIARGQARALLDSFGLTPRARQGLDVTPPGTPAGVRPAPTGSGQGRLPPGGDIAAQVRLLRARGGASDAA